MGELRFTGTVWLTRLGTGYWLSYFYWMCHKTDNNNSNNWKMFWFSTRLACPTSNGWTGLPSLPGLLGLLWSVGSTPCSLPPSAVYQLPAGMCDSLSCRNWQLEPVQTPPSPSQSYARQPPDWATPSFFLNYYFFTLLFCLCLFLPWFLAAQIQLKFN